MLEGKVILVTGGSQGIGAYLVEDLYRAGAFVYFIGRDESKLKSLTEGLKDIKSSGNIKYFVCDVVDALRVDEVVAEIVKERGRIDVLVNNAGITMDNILLRMKDEEWDRVINVNLKGVFIATKAVLKTMIKQRYGRIINISSVVASMGNAGQANYCASKAGIEGFTRSVAREVASRNITVNAVAPGYIETPMTEKLSEEIKKSMLSMIPLNRFGHSRDVSEAVKFLASDSAAYITGQVLHVNGGMYM